MKPEEGNTGVEKEDDDYIDIEAMDKAFSESAKKILDTATKNLIIKTKHQEKENAELRQSLSELIKLFEAIERGHTVFNKRISDETILEIKSAIERAKTLIEPKPLERSAQEQPADRSNNSENF